jgi:hypothetical protein
MLSYVLHPDEAWPNSFSKFLLEWSQGTWLMTWMVWLPACEVLRFMPPVFIFIFRLYLFYRKSIVKITIAPHNSSFSLDCSLLSLFIGRNIPVTAPFSVLPFRIQNGAEILSQPSTDYLTDNLSNAFLAFFLSKIALSSFDSLPSQAPHRLFAL